MKEYKISFQPTFHDQVIIEIQTDGDYGLLSITSGFKFNNERVHSSWEISPSLIKSFSEKMEQAAPLFLPTVSLGAIDGMNMDCYFADDEGFSNRFSVYSPRKNDDQAHLIFINSIYDLACQICTDEEITGALKNLAGYFPRE